MPVQSPELSDMLLAMLEARLSSVYIACPGIVQSYDQASQTADVQFAIKQAYTNETGDRVPETLPIIQKVPVVFPGSGVFSFTWPVSKGDTCLLVHSDKSIDTWLQTGGVADPGDDRRHDVSDVVAIMGLRTYTGALPASATSSSGMVLTSLNQLVLTSNALLLGDASASSAVVVQTALDYFATALITAIANLGSPAAATELSALATTLAIVGTPPVSPETVPQPPVVSSGWTAGTTKTKAT